MQKRLKTRAALKIFSALIASLALTGCRSVPPAWHGQLWAGDSASASVRRAQENLAIACSSAAFDDYVCMSYADMQSFYETFVLGCKTWRKGFEPMSFDEAMRLKAEAGLK